MSTPIKLMLALVLLLGLIAINIPSVSACLCAPSSSPSQALDQSVAVFAGKVIERKIVDSIASSDAVQITFQVSTVWKGPVQKNLIATTAFAGATCGYNFQVDQKYLVYAYGDENQLRVSSCSLTKPLAEAERDLTELSNGILLPIENTNWLSYLAVMFAFLIAGVAVMAIVMGKRALIGMDIKKIHFALNPVLVKEMRGRMRGPRAYLFLTATLVLLGGVSYGLYRLAAFSIQTFVGGGSSGALIGQSVFTGLVFLALIVICAIAPASTAGAISGEYERKTFDLLAATPLRPASILFGKLVAALSYVVLILLATIPLVSLSFVFGGIATIDMLQAFLLLLGFALTFSVFGLFFSALFRRTGFAVVASYLVLALFVVGTIFVYAVVAVMRGQQPPNWMLALNPFSAMASALVSPNVSPNTFGMSGLITPLLYLFGGGNINFNAGTVAQRPLWQYTVGVYAWLTIVLYLVSTQLVKPVQRFRLRVRAWILILIIALVPILLTPIVYGPLTPDRILAAMIWTLSPQRDLVANGKFDAPLDRTWTTKTQVERVDESGGEIKLISDSGRSVVHFSRVGNQHAETGITQEINQKVPSEGWVQLRIVLRVQTQDVPLCGVAGSECPLMIKLIYNDAAGKPHEWFKGFYAEGSPLEGDPGFCTTCEFREQHVMVSPNKWYTYESPNLVRDYVVGNPNPVFQAMPRLIRSITIAAAGHSYEAEVAEVALLTREGRPPDLGNESNAFPTPTPVLFQKFAPIPARPVMVPPPPTIAPPPTPTFTPEQP